MAHFAELDTNNNVLQVIVVDNSNIIVEGSEVEQKGVDFLEELLGHDLWKQTSYNNNFRKNFASEGFVYSEELDAFYDPRQPFDSWSLNEDTCKWEAPVECPGNVNDYMWSELTQQWTLLSETDD